MYTARRIRRDYNSAKTFIFKGLKKYVRHLCLPLDVDHIQERVLKLRKAGEIVEGNFSFF